ncbi:MAG: hypothetical protein PHN31_02700 [Candidatus Gracilibacteria bacterium]|nr:hypothetical protein [Candidatus Gracilibacteria bacterium]
MEDKIILDEFLLKSDNDIKKVYEIIKNDYHKNSINYMSSNDSQLFDYSYEYDYEKKVLKNNIVRFSYFGTKIRFLDNFDLFFDQSFLEKLKTKYELYKDNLKEDFVTFSFSFLDGKLNDIKLYFDVIVSENMKFNKFDEILFKRTKNEIVLISFSLNKNGISEEKMYFPINSFIKKLGNEVLKNNLLYKKFEKYKPFDILFRYKNDKISTIKYYYYKEENKEIEKEIENYFSGILIPKVDNIKEEIGIDFSLDGGIKKINYYISQYK